MYKPDRHEERNQYGFHTSRCSIRLLFGGNQSGKSRALAQEIAWWLTETHPYQETPKGPRIYVISHSYRTVQEGVWRHLQEIIPEWLVERQGPMVPGWQIPMFVRLTNGSQVDFLSAESSEDARRKVQAAAIDLAVLDEEVGNEIWEELQARRLARGGKVIVGATLVRSEPWCLDLEDRAETGDADVELFRLSTYRARDCGHVSARVVTEMENLLSDEERKVRLEGKSRRYEGLVYPAFKKMHICEPFQIPLEWTRYCAIDPGWRIFGVLWIAVAPDTKFVIYRELYETAKHYTQIVKQIFAAEGYTYSFEAKAWQMQPTTERVVIRWIDPSAFGHHESGELRVGSLLAMPPYNLFCAPAQNDLEVGIEMCARSMMPGLDGIPQMRVFSTCRNFIKEIRGYRRHRDSQDRSKNERRDAPIKRQDHLMDCFRYMMLGGLNWEAPPDPRFRSATDEELAFPFKYSVPQEEMVREHWLKLMERQKENHVTEHPGGIGSEY